MYLLYSTLSTLSSFLIQSIMFSRGVNYGWKDNKKITIRKKNNTK